MTDNTLQSQTTIKSIFHKEEEHSELIVNYARFVFTILIILLGFSIRNEIPYHSLLVIYIVGGIDLAYSIFLFFFLRSGKYSPFIKYISGTIDVLVLTIAIWVFGTYRSFKTEAFLVYFLWIAFASMRLSVVFTIYTGLLAVISYIVIVIIAIIGKTITIGTITEAFTTPKVSLTNIFIKMIFTIAVFIIAGYVAHIHKSLTIKSVKSEIKLKHLSKNLQKEVNHKTQELVEKNQKLVELEQMRKLLINTVIHDINNYATIINGDVEIMEFTYSDHHSINSYLNPLKNACDNIIGLTSNLLEINKMEESKMSLNIKDCSHQEIIDLAKSFTKNITFKNKQLQFDIIYPESYFNIKVDHYLFKRIIQNLIHNAIKYSFDSGTIRLSFIVDEKDNIISFFNSGKPITDEQKKLIFHKYVTLETKPSKYTNGLGLFFCKMVIENHNGKIWVETNKDGNFFKISFPS